MQVGKCSGAFAQGPRLHPAQITKSTACQKCHGGAQVGLAVGVGAEQGDLGQREFAHVNLAGPVLQADVHDNTAWGHGGQRSGACGDTAHGVDHEMEAAIRHGAIMRIEALAAGMVGDGRAAQRVGLGHVQVMHAIVAQEQRRQHANGAAAQHQHAAFRQRAHKAIHRQVDGMQRRGGGLGECCGHIA